MGYDNDGESGELRRPQQIGDELLRDGVDRGAGLVEQQHATRRIKESTGKTASKGNKLKLPGRKRRTRLNKEKLNWDSIGQMMGVHLFQRHAGHTDQSEDSGELLLVENILRINSVTRRARKEKRRLSNNLNR